MLSWTKVRWSSFLNPVTKHGHQKQAALCHLLQFLSSTKTGMRHESNSIDPEFVYLRGDEVIRDQRAGCVIQRCGWASCAGIKWGLSPDTTAANTVAAAHVLDTVSVSWNACRLDKYWIATQGWVDLGHLCKNILLVQERQRPADAHYSTPTPAMPHDG